MKILLCIATALLGFSCMDKEHKTTNEVPMKDSAAIQHDSAAISNQLKFGIRADSSAK